MYVLNMLPFRISSAGCAHRPYSCFVLRKGLSTRVFTTHVCKSRHMKVAGLVQAWCVKVHQHQQMVSSMNMLPMLGAPLLTSHQGCSWSVIKFLRHSAQWNLEHCEGGGTSLALVCQVHQQACAAACPDAHRTFRSCMHKCCAQLSCLWLAVMVCYVRHNVQQLSALPGGRCVGRFHLAASQACAAAYPGRTQNVVHTLCTQLGCLCQACLL